jgi:hypothetical protein
MVFRIELYKEDLINGLLLYQSAIFAFLPCYVGFLSSHFKPLQSSPWLVNLGPDLVGTNDHSFFYNPSLPRGRWVHQIGLRKRENNI